MKTEQELLEKIELCNKELDNIRNKKIILIREIFDNYKKIIELGGDINEEEYSWSVAGLSVI